MDPSSHKTNAPALPDLSQASTPLDPTPNVTNASSVRLEWDALISALAHKAVTPMGRERALALRPDLDRAGVLDSLALIEELRDLLHAGCTPPLSGLSDIRPLLHRAKRDGDLDPSDILHIGHSLEVLANLRDAFRHCEQPTQRARALVEDIDDHAPLARSIMLSIDPSGAILDAASADLRRLRRLSAGLREELKTRLSAMLDKLSRDAVLQENYFTLRNDRYVLPVRSDRRGGIKGIVHDASNSGQTLFIEPQALVDLGNKWRVAEASVLEEERRIIAALIARLAERSASILFDLDRAAVLDAFIARARLADLLQAEVPKISKTPSLALIGARHPGLMLALHAQGGESAMRGVVANDILIESPSRALVISGPNAGGKTVALKTAGLCALMLRAGLPIPALASSQLSLFADTLAVLGDEQSVDAHLSTFSAHIVALQQMLDMVRQQQAQGLPSLCLIDEIARGTDPEQGACLGQALLENLVEAGALVIATTHYDRLKALALDDPRFRNAAVQLDAQGQRPNFRLYLNQPGGSNAFAIARSLGLDTTVLARAQDLSGPDAKRVDGYLDELAKERSALAQTRRELQRAQSALDDKQRALQQERALLKKKTQALRSQARSELLGDVHKARREVAEIIATLQSGRRDPRRADQAAHALKAIEAKVQARLQQASDDDDSQVSHAAESALAVGQKVWHKGLSREATILQIKGQGRGAHAEVQCGPMRSRVKLSQLRPLRPEEKTQTKKTGREVRRQRAGQNLKNSVEQFSAAPNRPPRSAHNTLDLRGQRVDEALDNCTRFFDQMLRDNTGSVFLLHGHGTNALKEALRRELPSSTYVSTLRPADDQDGGDAFTVVDLDL